MAYDPKTAGDYLPMIAKALDQLLEETFGQKLHLVLVIGDGEQASIASNQTPVNITKMLETAMKPLKDIPPDLSEMIDDLKRAQAMEHNASEQTH